MGNACAKLTPEQRAEIEKSRMIERMIEEERRAQLAESKLLLLGAGESGKSTIAKQMKMIYLSGFSDQERQAYKPLIYVNIVGAAQTMITQARKRSLSLEPLDDSCDELQAISLSGPIDYTQALAEKVQALWNHATVQELLKVSNEFSLSDSAPFFLSNCMRYSQAGYVVTDDDILRVRSKTTGIIETAFTIKRKKIRMVDVGGQRNERKKWIHCFQDVTCILFCAALNDYDLVLEEDESVNRMHESLALFDETINSYWFERTNIILFLNKIDLFEKKIATKDLKCCFPNYEDGCNADKAGKYILQKFLEKNKANEMRRVYSHFTCATSTENILVVFKAVQAIILIDVMTDVL